jgi:prolactin regulatory element-binding protein
MGKRIESFYIDKFPIYACAYIAQDQLLLAGGGGGKTKAGLSNKLLVYSLAANAQGQYTSVGELVLAGDEDAPAALAVHEDLILAGVNEAEEARRKSKENHHLRTYKLDRSVGKSGDAVNIRPKLSYGILDLDIEADDYQKHTRISADGKYAALLSAEGKAALVDLTSYRRQASKQLDDAKEPCVNIAFWNDCLLAATKTSLFRVPLTQKTPEDEEKEIFNLSRIRILSRYKIAQVVVFDKDRILLGMNSMDGKSAFVALYRIFKGELRQSHVRHLPSRISGITVDSLQQQQDSTAGRKVAIAMGDGGLLLVDGRLEVLRRFRNLHQFPASACAFAPNGQQLVTCSIDYKVNVLDLRGVGQTDMTRLLAVAVFLLVLLYLISRILL